MSNELPIPKASGVCDHCNTERPHGKPEYVVGFLFVQEPCPGAQRFVVLVRKCKPAWQKDRLNGVGGKGEPGESPLVAMVREFREETGEDRPTGWERFFYTELNDCVLYFYRAFDVFSAAKTVEKEEIEFINVEDLFSPKWSIRTINNLRWLIPLALSGEQITAEHYEPKNF